MDHKYDTSDYIAVDIPRPADERLRKLEAEYTSLINEYSKLDDINCDLNVKLSIALKALKAISQYEVPDDGDCFINREDMSNIAAAALKEIEGEK